MSSQASPSATTASSASSFSTSSTDLISSIVAATTAPSAASATSNPSESLATQEQDNKRDHVLVIVLGSVLAGLLLLLIGFAIFYCCRRKRRRLQQSSSAGELDGSSMHRVSTERLMRESSDGPCVDRRWSLLAAQKTRFSRLTAPDASPPRSRARPMLAGPLTPHGGLWDASMASGPAANSPATLSVRETWQDLSSFGIPTSYGRPQQEPMALTPLCSTQKSSSQSEAGLQGPPLPFKQAETSADTVKDVPRRSSSFLKRCRKSRHRSISIGEEGRIHYPSEEELSRFRFGLRTPEAASEATWKRGQTYGDQSLFDGNFVDFLESSRRRSSTPYGREVC